MLNKHVLEDVQLTSAYVLAIVYVRGCESSPNLRNKRGIISSKG